MNDREEFEKWYGADRGDDQYHKDQCWDTWQARASLPVNVPEFIGPLYSWLARAHFERPQDEARAAEFSKLLRDYISAAPKAGRE